MEQHNAPRMGYGKTGMQHVQEAGGARVMGKACETLLVGRYPDLHEERSKERREGKDGCQAESGR